VLHLAKLLALPTNIKLGFKGLTETNALAHSEYLYITDVKGFITLGPESLFFLPNLKRGFPGANTPAYFSIVSYKEKKAYHINTWDQFNESFLVTFSQSFVS
jgi:hypothetical protein